MSGPMDEGYFTSFRKFASDTGGAYLAGAIFLFVVGILMIVFIFVSSINNNLRNLKIIYAILGVLIIMAALVLVYKAFYDWRIRSEIVAPVGPVTPISVSTPVMASIATTPVNTPVNGCTRQVAPNGVVTEICYENHPYQVRIPQAPLVVPQPDRIETRNQVTAQEKQTKKELEIDTRVSAPFLVSGQQPMPGPAVLLGTGITPTVSPAGTPRASISVSSTNSGGNWGKYPHHYQGGQTYSYVYPQQTMQQPIQYVQQPQPMQYVYPTQSYTPMPMGGRTGGGAVRNRVASRV
jgi:hypothetical protein